MSTLGPLYPTADGTQASLGFSTGTTAWSLINSDPDTAPTTASWVEGLYNTANAELWMVLQDTPTDFQSMDSVEIRVYIQSTGTLSNDTVQVQVGIATADNTETFLAGASSTTAQQAANWTGGTFTGQVYVVNCTYVNTTAAKSAWDAGYLHISWTKSKAGGWDSGTLQVAAIEVNGVYTAASQDFSGSGSISHTHSTSATGVKNAKGAGSVSHTQATAATYTGPAYDGSGSISQTHSVTATGQKNAYTPVGVSTPGYYDFDGTVNAHVSTPFHSSLNTFTTQLEAIVCAHFDNRFKGGYDNLMTMGDPSSEGSLFVFRRPPSIDSLQISWRQSDSNFGTVSSTTGIAIDTGPRWYRVTQDLQDSGNRTTTFYYSDDPVTTDPASVSWTQHGSPIQSAVGVIAYEDGVTEGVYVGNRSDEPSEAMQGKIYKAQLRNSIGGTIVANPDFTVNDQSGGGDDPVSLGSGVAYSSGAYIIGTTTNDFLTVPNASLADPTGDMELIAWVAYDDWSPSTWAPIITKHSGTGDLAYLWQLRPGTAGNSTMRLEVYDAANSIAVNLTSDNFTEPVGGAGRWLRAVYDADNGASGHSVTFYTSTDASTTDPSSVFWTQVGSVKTGSGAITSHPSTTADTRLVGTDFASNQALAASELRQVQIKYGGVEQFRLDSSLVDTTGKVWTADAGATYTGVGGGIGYYDLDGTSTSYVNTPDHASFDVTDLDVRVCVALDNYTPATNQWFLSRFHTSGDRSWAGPAVLTSGTVQFAFSPDGTNTTYVTTGGIYTVTEETGVSGGEHVWLRVTMDVDNGSSQYQVRMYWSTDPITTDPASVSWTEWNGTLSNGTGAATSIHAGSNPIEVGRFNSSSNGINGRVYKAQVRDGINGTIVASPDFTSNDGSPDDPHNTWEQTTTTGGSITVGGTPPAYTTDANSQFRTAAPSYPTPSSSEILDVKAYVAVTTYNARTYQHILGEQINDNASGRWSIYAYWDASNLRLRVGQQDGIWADSVAGSNILPIDGTGRWIRVVMDTNAANEVTFYTSTDSPNTDPDSVSWSLFSQTTLTAWTWDSGATYCWVGGDATNGEDFGGKVWRVKATSGGTTFIDFTPDASDSAGKVWTAGSGATWTVPAAVSGVEITHTHSTSATGTPVNNDRSGSGSISQTHSATAAGTKKASGAGSVSHTSSTSATGQKNAAGAGSVSHTQATAATGNALELRSGSGSISHTHSISATGVKGAAGAAAIAVRHAASAAPMRDGVLEALDSWSGDDTVVGAATVADAVAPGSGVGSYAVFFTGMSLFALDIPNKSLLDASLKDHRGWRVAILARLVSDNPGDWTRGWSLSPDFGGNRIGQDYPVSNGSNDDLWQWFVFTENDNVANDPTIYANDIYFALWNETGSPSANTRWHIAEVHIHRPRYSATAETTLTHPSSATATGKRAGAGSISHTAATTAAGRKDTAGAASITQTHSTTAVGTGPNVDKSGSGSISHGHTTSATGVKGGAGAATITSISVTSGVNLGDNRLEPLQDLYATNWVGAATPEDAVAPGSGVTSYAERDDGRGTALYTFLDGIPYLQTLSDLRPLDFRIQLLWRWLPRNASPVETNYSQSWETPSYYLGYTYDDVPTHGAWHWKEFSTRTNTGGSPAQEGRLIYWSLVQTPLELDYYWQIAEVRIYVGRYDEGVITHTHTTAATGTRSGTASVSHGHTTAATGQKNTAGAGSVSHGHTTTAAGFPLEHRSGSASISHSHSTAAAGIAAEDRVGSGSVSHTSSTAATGTKQVTGTGSISHSHTVTGTGASDQTKHAFGSGAIAHIATVAATGVKGSASTAAVAVTHTVEATGGRYAAATITVTATATATGSRSYPGSVVVSSATAAAGVKGARGSASVAVAVAFGYDWAMYPRPVSTGAHKTTGENRGNLTRGSSGFGTTKPKSQPANDTR